MGGNGTFAVGKIVAYQWKSVGSVGGVKILAPANKHGSHKLPEEAHSSKMYILQYGDGNFAQLRIYDKNHKLRFEIGYHREPNLDKSSRPVLHYHICNGANDRSKARIANQKIYDKFKKYFTGVVYP